MIARKPQKFSLNSGETNSEQLHKERASDFSDKPQQTKFASDTATSILEELGVKKTTSNKTNKNSLLNVQRKSSPIKNPILEQSELDKSLLKDLKKQKAATKNNKVKQAPGKNTTVFLRESVKKRDKIAAISFQYLREKTKNLNF